jgi:1-pyrroline-5-carboxylate dehydrogenase
MSTLASFQHVPHGSGAEAPVRDGTAASAPQPVPQMGGIVGFAGVRAVPAPVNEPVKSYAPGSPERAELKARLTAMAGERAEIPLVVGGRRVHTGDVQPVTNPCAHQEVLAEFHRAREQDVTAAVDAARDAHREWANWAWEDRAAVFLRAAELLATTRRQTVNAATMLGQARPRTRPRSTRVRAHRLPALQRRVRAGDLRGAAAERPHAVEPARLPAARGVRVRGDAVQLHAIAGNLPTSAALMGNTVVWKPAATAMLSAWHVMQLLEEAGLPPGVINFVPATPRR